LDIDREKLIGFIKANDTTYSELDFSEHTIEWLIKVGFSALTFVMKNATFAKLQNVISKPKDKITFFEIKNNFYR
jgi:hypothetical protein